MTNEEIADLVHRKVAERYKPLVAKNTIKYTTVASGKTIKDVYDRLVESLKTETKSLTMNKTLLGPENFSITKQRHPTITGQGGMPLYEGSVTVVFEIE